MRAWLFAATLSSGLAFGQESPDMGPSELPIVEPPRIVQYIEADYPADARASGIEASVDLLVELDERGVVVDVRVERRIGRGFDEAAVAAVKKMSFTPARTNAGPVAVAFPFTYVFSLPKQDGAPEDLPILTPPAVKDYVEAAYPAEALALHLQGTVKLFVTLDETGAVGDAVVSEGIGNGFDEAALDAVKRMTFTPAQTSKGPVGVVFEFAYTFTLQPEVPVEALPAPINVDGRIREMGTRTPIAGAIILLADTELTTTTDAEGRFSLRGVPVGPHTLRVRDPAHIELDQSIEVTAGEVTSADLWIRALTYRENESVAYYQKERQEVTRRTLTIDEIKSIPGTFGDPVKVIQTLPGAARSPFGTGLLIIRGSNPEDSAVYVDGVRIPIVYHLTGTTSVLSPDVVQAVDYLPGGYGVQYGRSMGGTIDVRTKEKFGEKKLIWGTDVLDSQIWFEGNVGKNSEHGLAVGARRSYIDALLPAFTQNVGFTIKPVYWDYQLKWVPTLKNPKDHFSAFVFGFQDILGIQSDEGTTQGTDQDTQGDLRTVYQSHRIILRWRHEFSDKLKLDLRPSVGVDLTELGLGADFKLSSWNVLFQMRGDLNWTPTPAVEINPGVDFIGGPYNFDFKSPFSFADLDDPLAERDSVGFDGKGTAWSPDVFLKVNFRPLKDRERWLMTVGGRFNSALYVINGGITYDGGTQRTNILSGDARFATRFIAYEEGDLSTTLKASTGLYHQPPQPFESIGLGTAAKLRAEQSFNSSLGLEQRITQAVSVDLDGFYRMSNDLVIFNDAFSGAGSQPFTNGGQGYAAGFELMVKHAPVKRFFGWISYTFSRSFLRDDKEAEWTRFDYDQPHIFSAQGGYNFPFDIGISAQIQVVSGNPDTKFNAGVYDVDGNFYNGFQIGAGNAERLPTFVQTSFRIDKTWTFRKWQLETYLDLINAIRGVNPETTVYNYDYSEWAYVRGLPLIPNLGLEFRFWP